MRIFYNVIWLFLLICFSTSYSQVPFNINPDWVSSDVSNYATGGAFADIDLDGWLDFVTANGNDKARQKVSVYYNDGTGNYPSNPNWQSTDIDYNGHLDVGDVNGDGYPDVAVSVYLGENRFNDPGKVKLYINNNGTLSSLPDWVSGDEVFTFSCAFGDADGDGDLDLAVAGGESYEYDPEQPRIYYNNNGTLESLPSWKAQSAQYSYDVNWADFDNDGDLDLVFAGENFPNRIFENNNGSISTTPIWESTDTYQLANSLFIGDVNNDGFFDLAISDNNQLSGEGRFKIYLNNNGVMNTTPFWVSSFSGFGSGIMLVDIDNDLDLDLLTGGWFDTVRVYLNYAGNFNTYPDYKSYTNSVVEAIVCADIDKDAIDEYEHQLIANGTNNLFYLDRTPLQLISKVIVDNDTLSYNEYCYDLENGWISFATAPDSGALIKIQTAVSWDLDLGITNWDPNKGNYLFYNTSDPVYVSEETEFLGGFILYQNYPNPFNPSTKIRFTVPTDTRANMQDVSLKIYDMLGNEVATLLNNELKTGEYEVEFDTKNNVDGLPSGIYFYQLKIGSFMQTKKMILMK